MAPYRLTIVQLAGRFSLDASPGSDSGAGADAGDPEYFAFGGGACSASGGRSAGPFAVLWLVLLVLGLALRRRSLARAVAVLALVVAAPTLARADGFRLDRHRAPTMPEDLLWAERAAVGGDRSPFGRITLDFSDDPLVTRDADGNQHEKVIDHQIGLHLSGGVSLLDRLHLAFALPMFFQATDAVEPETGMRLQDPDEWGLGDLMVDARYVLLDRDQPVELAVGLTLGAPIGNGEALAADETVTAAPRVIVSRELPRIGGFASLSLGVLLRGEAEYGDLELGPETFFTAGVLVPVADRLGVTAEVSGSTTFSRAFSAEQTPVEGMLGGRFEITERLVASAGLGTGFTRGYGAPDVRASAMIGYRRPPSESRAAEPEPEAPPPPPDTDGDGYVDPEDGCPEQPEDFDDFEDGDGCPDPDNDEDGLLDVDDECPDDPEDFDDFEDEDGCNDLDNDQDGVEDPEDACPDEPEDRDGFEDEDGCPDPDNDQDTILDADDQCPLDPETMNGVDDEDGCPDMVRVDRETRQIRILEPVHFATASHRILRRSHGMLDEMAALILQKPELGRVSVEGHTDSRGSERYNQRLSERRAQSVMEYLVEAGVEAERLEAHGYGESRPISSNDTATGRAENRRVEFRLVDLPETVVLDEAPAEGQDVPAEDGDAVPAEETGADAGE